MYQKPKLKKIGFITHSPMYTLIGGLLMRNFPDKQALKLYLDFSKGIVNDWIIGWI